MDPSLAPASGQVAQEPWFGEMMGSYVDDIGLALLVLLLSVIIGSLVSAAIKRIGRRGSIQSNRVYRLVAGSINTIIIIAGLISSLGTLGVDITAMVAGLGLTGFAVGFALKDAVANLVAGLLIVMYKPFDIGEDIDISGHVGTVIDINLRYVTIKTDEADIMVPNNNFVTNVIKRKHHKTPLATASEATPD